VSSTSEQCELARLSDLAAKGDGPETRKIHIALLTPYTGSNFGDAAIQDAVIANMRLRLPGVQFAGITQNCQNFRSRHGADAFPLCGNNIAFFGMSELGNSSERQKISKQSSVGVVFARLKKALKAIPGAAKSLRGACSAGLVIVRELRHCIRGYRLLRRQDLLVVSGGGQLAGEWGGAWGHPYALFKWAVLARAARIPVVVASVGASQVTDRTARFFLSSALRLAKYRSYRDEKSRQIAAGLLANAGRDTVLADLAFSLPDTNLPTASARPQAQGQTTVALSPIAVGKPGVWPKPDSALYERYISETARLLIQLAERGFFLRVVFSCTWDREQVMPDLWARLGPEQERRLRARMNIPPINSWQELVAVLRGSDFLISSRLHSAILGFIAGTPAVAVSFDPKVDSLMEDLGQQDYLLDIHDFTAERVVSALDRLAAKRDIALERLLDYRERVLSGFERQYDLFAQLSIGKKVRRAHGVAEAPEHRKA
jgi:polysaccharide pyruvyl transferase WcaK-like protein